MPPTIAITMAPTHQGSIKKIFINVTTTPTINMRRETINPISISSIYLTSFLNHVVNNYHCTIAMSYNIRYSSFIVTNNQLPNL